MWFGFVFFWSLVMFGIFSCACWCCYILNSQEASKSRRLSLKREVLNSLAVLIHSHQYKPTKILHGRKITFFMNLTIDKNMMCQKWKRCQKSFSSALLFGIQKAAQCRRKSVCSQVSWLQLLSERPWTANEIYLDSLASSLCYNYPQLSILDVERMLINQ